ncbi:MAG: hypothetical protein ACLR23_04915 [Clostridia bacterium]
MDAGICPQYITHRVPLIVASTLRRYAAIPFDGLPDAWKILTAC